MRILVVVTLLASSAAVAQTARPEERRTVIDMDESVIEGSLKIPDQIVIREGHPNKFNSLVRVRREFRRELLASAAQL